MRLAWLVFLSSPALLFFALTSGCVFACVPLSVLRENPF